MVHLDLAVNRAHYPLLKSGIAPKGKRRVLYIGNDHPGKNLPYLDSIAASWANGEIYWAGRGRTFKHLRPMGYLDFSSNEGKAKIETFDFLITLGTADANPTTILEAMSWGLIPICTPTSGYEDEPGIVTAPLDDVEAVCRILDKLQFADDSEIFRLRSAGERRIAEHYNWQRFTEQVEDAIGSTLTPTIEARKPKQSAGYPGWTLGVLAKVLIKNVLYVVEDLWPGFSIRGRMMMRLRNALGK